MNALKIAKAVGKIWLYTTGGLFGLAAVLAVGNHLAGVETPKAAAQAAHAKPLTVQEVVDRHEIKMRWGCEDAIKRGLKDPRSYKPNDVGMWPSMEDGATVMVKIDFTARNGFGGVTRNKAVCHATSKGNIISAKFL